MACIKEIRTKIDSIRNIQKIAGAMEMISASKMYKVKKHMSLSMPYIVGIRKVIDHLITGKLEYQHAYCIARNVKCVGYWVISTDKGLVGGLNINLFRVLLHDINKWSNASVTVKLAIFGSKAVSFFRHMKCIEVVSYMDDIGDVPKFSKLIGLVKVMLQLYNMHKVDRLYLIYNKFINTLSQVPTVLQIVPVVSSENISVQSGYWDYLYEPDSKTLLDILLQRYIESQIYQGIIENAVSEQSARMIAMKTAADNGEIIINDLKLFYNKIRQNKITQELIEIVSGASVL